MDSEKNLTLSGMTGKHVLYVFFAIGIIGTCLYLTNHYIGVHFPTGITGQKTMCDISSFWTCDTASQSAASNIYGIPISIFGMFFGIFLLVGSIFTSEEMERTNKTLAALNIIGCVALLLYSLIGLGTMCPMCSVYYVLSGIVAFLLIKYGVPGFGVSPKLLAIYAGLTLTVVVPLKIHFNDKKSNYDSIAKDLIQQYNSLPNLGNPEPSSAFRIAKATEKFTDAPLQLSLFSDFQCPSCKVLSDQMPEISKRYAGKINIQYYYYPLDHHCNSEVQRPFHTMACKAATISTCSGERFHEVHDHIFANQKQMTSGWLDNYAKKLGIEKCATKPETLDLVKSHIEIAKKFKVRSTPTFLVNGVKIEGVLPVHQLYVILDEILKRSGP